MKECAEYCEWGGYEGCLEREDLDGVEEGWVRIREGAFGGCDFPPPEQASST